MQLLFKKGAWQRLFIALGGAAAIVVTSNAMSLCEKYYSLSLPKLLDLLSTSEPSLLVQMLADKRCPFFEVYNEYCSMISKDRATELAAYFYISDDPNRFLLATAKCRSHALFEALPLSHRQMPIVDDHEHYNDGMDHLECRRSFFSHLSKLTGPARNPLNWISLDRAIAPGFYEIQNLPIDILLDMFRVRWVMLNLNALHGAGAFRRIHEELFLELNKPFARPGYLIRMAVKLLVYRDTFSRICASRNLSWGRDEEMRLNFTVAESTDAFSSKVTLIAAANPTAAPTIEAILQFFKDPSVFDYAVIKPEVLGDGNKAIGNLVLFDLAELHVRIILNDQQGTFYTGFFHSLEYQHVSPVSVIDALRHNIRDIALPERAGNDRRIFYALYHFDQVDGLKKTHRFLRQKLSHRHHFAGSDWTTFTDASSADSNFSLELKMKYRKCTAEHKMAKILGHNLTKHLQTGTPLPFHIDFSTLSWALNASRSLRSLNHQLIYEALCTPFEIALPEYEWRYLRIE